MKVHTYEQNISLIRLISTAVRSWQRCFYITFRKPYTFTMYASPQDWNFSEGIYFRKVDFFWKVDFFQEGKGRLFWKVDFSKGRFDLGDVPPPSPGLNFF